MALLACFESPLLAGPQTRLSVQAGVSRLGLQEFWGERGWCGVVICVCVGVSCALSRTGADKGQRRREPEDRGTESTGWGGAGRREPLRSSQAGCKQGYIYGAGGVSVSMAVRVDNDRRWYFCSIKVQASGPGMPRSLDPPRPLWCDRQSSSFSGRIHHSPAPGSRGQEISRVILMHLGGSTSWSEL